MMGVTEFDYYCYSLLRDGDISYLTFLCWIR